jgi:asparagine synthase (glutamine-hydrolysing)
MCGILQVFSRKKPVERARFESALARMKHRGPDHTGTFYHDDGIPLRDGSRVFAASGHQRLSILDLCERSNQPFRRAGRCLVFNGEIYNFRELRGELEASGCSFTTTGDTEVLFEGLHLHGLDFLRRCNGMWGFTYLDENRGIVLAGRDRHGKKPVFYQKNNDHIIVSSTIRPVFHFAGSPPAFRDDMVDSYIAHGVMFPPADDSTHFHDLRQIPPGHTLEIDLRDWSLRTNRYYNPADEVAARTPGEEELAPLLRDAVVARLVSDRKVGLLLSGGIDSTLVLSVIHSQGLQDQVRCYIGETGRSEDAAYARRCVEQLGIEASIIDLGYGEDTFDRHLRMCEHQEKPFPFLGSSMAMSEMYERVAQDDVRVVLDGTGGDEFFGGYWDRQYPVALREALATGDFAWLRSSLPKAPKPLTRVNQAIANTLWRNDRVHFDLREFRKRWSPPSLALGFQKTHPPLADPLACPPARFTDTLLRDASPGGRLGEWIWHNDRNAMMSGIENRSPILDYRLVPFAGTGYATKYVAEWNKHQLRKAFDSFTPLPTQWRREKQGFRWNGRVFLRQNQQAILDLIASSRYLASRYDTRRYVDKARSNNRFFVNTLTPRLLCVAGIEEKLGLSS